MRLNARPMGAWIRVLPAKLHLPSVAFIQVIAESVTGRSSSKKSASSANSPTTLRIAGFTNAGYSSIRMNSLLLTGIGVPAKPRQLS